MIQNQFSPEEQEKIKAEFEKFDTPQKRIDLLKEHGITHHFLVSGVELASIQQGTNQLNGECRKWKTFSQATLGVSTPEDALEAAKRQQIHRKGIADDRMRYRNALVAIMEKTRIGGESPNLGVWQIAQKAVNNIPSEREE